MREVETLFLEIKVLDDGALRARRKDRKPLTDADREEARQVADSAKVLPKTSEAERWLEAQGVPEADRQAILEEAARWVLKDGRWQRAKVEDEHAARVRQ